MKDNRSTQEIVVAQPVVASEAVHEMRDNEECSLFNSAYAYNRGYSRARCSCGWKSIPMIKEEALLMAYALHASGRL